MKLQLFLIIVLFLGFAGSLTAQSTKIVTLAGYKLNPPVPSPATGSVTLTLKNDSLFVKGSFSDLTSSYFSSGIYFEEGSSLNRIFRLRAQLNENETGGEFKESQNRFSITPSQKNLLKVGKLYIRISSANHQQGEIRGGI